MKTTRESATVAETKLAQMEKCLTLIEDIAFRAANSKDPGHVVYALQELSQVLIERTGTEQTYFFPSDQISGLAALQEELEWVDCFSQSMAASGTGGSDDSPDGLEDLKRLDCGDFVM